MNTRPMLALTLAFATPLLACDTEVEGPDDVDYRAVGHIDLATVTHTPWLADALGADMFDHGGDFQACADVLRQAQAVTVGAGEDVFEVYVQGPIDAAAANACSDRIDAEVAKKSSPSDSKPTPEALMLADDLFVVFGGDVTPSSARLKGLMAMDPSPKGDQPMWGIAFADGKDDPIKHIEAWASTSRGLDAHVELRFNDEGKAAETFGKATLGLTALRLSDDVGELASAVDVSSNGDTMTVEVHATATQLKALMKKHKAKGKSGASVRAEAHAGHAPGDGGGSFRIQIGSSHE